MLCLKETLKNSFCLFCFHLAEYIIQNLGGNQGNKKIMLYCYFDYVYLNWNLMETNILFNSFVSFLIDKIL